jgi:hypothetical protein
MSLNEVKNNVDELFRFEASENLSVEDSAYYLIDDEAFYVQVCLGGTYGGATSYIAGHHQTLPDDFINSTHGEFSELEGAMRKIINLKEQTND